MRDRHFNSDGVIHLGTEVYVNRSIALQLLNETVEGNYGEERSLRWV